ncbi:hypothetical protein GCT13_40920 [Paraburkholderia sp. CNPSo 3157]|uniref:Uncharacterized protein n=1 Tax=Paraburkholderia franconis TaxID=2654983 RepID=A0A7X1NJ84_9BURK|nr:hypothetical protein [Paraburkholderia franconis]MPW22983.1 hypothetical protein [Paraburkholderia franconis]
MDKPHVHSPIERFAVDVHSRGPPMPDVDSKRNANRVDDSDVSAQIGQLPLPVDIACDARARGSRHDQRRADARNGRNAIEMQGYPVTVGGAGGRHQSADVKLTVSSADAQVKGGYVFGGTSAPNDGQQKLPSG